MRVDGIDRDGQFAGDLRPGKVRRQIPQYSELAWAELLRLRRCGLVSGRQRRAVYDVQDVGKERGVSCLVPRQGFQQLPRARYRERQDEPVGLGERQSAFGGLVRRVLVTELTVG